MAAPLPSIRSLDPGVQPGFPRNLGRGLMAGAALAALAACTDFDPDLRRYSTGGFATSDAARQVSASRPGADGRGIISYPSFQVAVARRGDTVASVASRIGLSADELANFNGLKTGDTLRPGEVIALPRRVAEPTGGPIAPAAPTGGGSLAPEQVDVATIAGGAIDRAAGSAPSPTPAAPAAGPEPIRHQVKRGESGYTIARLYNVTVRSLAEWNGLTGDMTLREGQYLLIPVAVPGQAGGSGGVSAPGVGTATPEPPSARTPLPDERTTPAAAGVAGAPASPDLAGGASSRARLQMPVAGKIFREYSKGKNEGIDISAPAGTAVAAAEAGTVASITTSTDSVQIVLIRHSGNLLTVYAGLDQLKVKRGDKVTRGQQIGVVKAGNPAFLHFEVRQGLESTDPMPFLR